MPKLDIDNIPQSNATGYPEPFNREVEGRWWRRLAPVAGLTQMGASHVVLKPGGWSSQRHWHEGEDELVIMLSGEAVLIEDDGETPMRPGDIAAWPAGDGNGHHLVNRSQARVLCLETGSRRPAEDDCDYPDIDLHIGPGRDAGFTHKDGRPYPSGR